MAVLPHTAAWGTQARLEKGPPAACWWGAPSLPPQRPLRTPWFPGALPACRRRAHQVRVTEETEGWGLPSRSWGCCLQRAEGLASVARVVVGASLLGSACPGVGVTMASWTPAWPRGCWPCPGRWGPQEAESPLGTLLLSDVPCGWAAGMPVSVAQGLLPGGCGERGFLPSGVGGPGGPCAPAPAALWPGACVTSRPQLSYLETAITIVRFRGQGSPTSTLLTFAPDSPGVGGLLWAVVSAPLWPQCPSHAISVCLRVVAIEPSPNVAQCPRGAERGVENLGLGSKWGGGGDGGRGEHPQAARAPGGEKLQPDPGCPCGWPCWAQRLPSGGRPWSAGRTGPGQSAEPAACSPGSLRLVGLLPPVGAATPRRGPWCSREKSEGARCGRSGALSPWGPLTKG